jgi:hypothetical protein
MSFRWTALGSFGIADNPASMMMNENGVQFQAALRKSYNPSRAIIGAG